MFEVQDNDGSLSWILEKMSAAKKKAKGSFVPKPQKPLIDAETKKRQAELAVTRATELDLWKKWKKGGEKPEHLDPLLKSLSRVLYKRANEAGKGRVEVPTAAIDFAHKQQAVNALRSFDPNKGVKLTTWVTTNLKKVSRFIHNTQNLTRITEPLAMKIGTFRAVKADLTERLGHEPDDHSMHEALVPHGYSMKDIKRLNKEVRKSYVSGQGGLDDVQSALNSSPDVEVIHLVVPQLSKSELAVHEYTFGLNGKAKLNPGAIAKKLKMDNSKVAKLRTSIWKKMEPHLGG